MPDLPAQPPAEFVSYLGEGMHTAFRKGADHPSATQIHRLIDHMPNADWHGIVAFVAEGMWPMVLRLVGEAADPWRETADGLIGALAADAAEAADAAAGPRGWTLIEGGGEACCGSHRPQNGRPLIPAPQLGEGRMRAACCDPDDCGPCCPQCPTCPTHNPGVR
jgi:hypothetical protein